MEISLISTCLLKFEMNEYLSFIVQQKRISCILQLKLPLVHIHESQHVRQRNGFVWCKKW